MRRRGFAMVLVLGLAVVLLLAVGALFQQGQDSVAQAARVEGRLALAGLLKNAAAESWWLTANPGRFPAAPEPADPEPIAFYRLLRNRAPVAEVRPKRRLVTGVHASRVPVGGTLEILDVTVRNRDRSAKANVQQGTLELRATGEFRGDRVVVRLALVELRSYWLTGPAQAPRLQFDDALIAQGLEELP